jgi:hypothetical protein
MRAGCELQFSGLPPVQTARIASASKTMWPLAVASFSETAAAIPPHQLPSTDTPQPDIAIVNP